MVIMYTMILFIIVFTLITLTTSTCPKGMLVVYRLSLRTQWEEKIFPKQFPQWRPAAQWSKTIGREPQVYNVFGKIPKKGVGGIKRTRLSCFKISYFKLSKIILIRLD